MELLPRGRVESAEDGKPCPEADFISQQVYGFSDREIQNSGRDRAGDS